MFFGIFVLNRVSYLSFYVVIRVSVYQFCLKQGRKISDICFEQGQGMRGRGAPPHQRIYRVPPGLHRTFVPIVSGQPTAQANCDVMCGHVIDTQSVQVN